MGRTLNRCALVFVLVSLLLLVTACAFRGAGKAESDLRKDLARIGGYRALGKPRSVTCTKSDAPHRVDPRIHAAYTCDVVYGNGTSGPVCYSRPRFGRGVGIFAPGITCEALAQRWATINRGQMP